MNPDIEDSKAVRVARRLIVAWPLLMLPFVPEIGKMIAGLVLTAVLHQGAVQ